MPEASHSDETLIERSRSGDTDAFAELVRRYQDYMHNAVVHLVGAGHDAEDLTQEVFMKAYRGLPGFQQRSQFSTWLYGIMLNCVRSHWRKKGRGPDLMSLEAGGHDDQSAPDPPARRTSRPEERVMQEERIEVVRRGIQQLPPDLREVVVLRDLQGMAYKELAQTLDLPLGTVKSRLARGRRALRDEIAPILAE